MLNVELIWFNLILSTYSFAFSELINFKIWDFLFIEGKGTEVIMFISCFKALSSSMNDKLSKMFKFDYLLKLTDIDEAVCY